ncbi:MAG: GNAT family N-acetyltransferase [Magnetococcales bacterium]|nr:GNAT family N-acetyltransferase [Magnetococcales bacterium]
MSSSPPRVEKLSRQHAVEHFDCGHPGLNRFLHRHALLNQRANAAQTYVGVNEEDILGYYTLAVGAIQWADAPPRMSQGLARHPIPILILARLAVSRTWQRQGVGAGLLKDALLRTLRAADIVGIRALVVHAKEEARPFYHHFGFQPAPTDLHHLYMLIKEIRRAAGVDD